MIVYAVLDESLSPTSPLGAIDTFVRREDAEPFIASVQRDDQLASRWALNPSPHQGPALDALATRL